LFVALDTCWFSGAIVIIEIRRHILMDDSRVPFVYKILKMAKYELLHFINRQIGCPE